ncbi:MAG TPA: hypothetical protein PK830_09820 [Candidatus Atribacteria bacterium]|nr:hypothetical protein [Candidatus Atribacteria bacterium]
MAYKFTTVDICYEDLGSGKVLYNERGATAFPVRLASEIFLRCKSILQKDGAYGPYNLYDPLCGGAYLITALGFIHGESIKRIYASDIEEKAVKLAERNLSLLYEPGLSNRIRQLERMRNEFHKPSHEEALQSAYRLKKRVGELSMQHRPVCFVADATDAGSLDMISDRIDIVITDLPYGDIVDWVNKADTNKHVQSMLNKLKLVLNMNSVVAIVSREKLGPNYTGYKRAEYFKHGKRHISIFRPDAV